MQRLLMITLGLLLIGCTMTLAEDHLLFVSAFAPGEKGAIHSYLFDSDAG